MQKKYVVEVHNHKWGNYTREFDTKKEAEKFVDETCPDMNTYCYLYKLMSINLEKVS